MLGGQLRRTRICHVRGGASWRADLNSEQLPLEASGVREGHGAHLGVADLDRVPNGGHRSPRCSFRRQLHAHAATRTFCAGLDPRARISTPGEVGPANGYPGNPSNPSPKAGNCRLKAPSSSIEFRTGMGGIRYRNPRQSIILPARLSESRRPANILWIFVPYRNPVIGRESGFEAENPEAETRRQGSRRRRSGKSPKP